MSEQREAKYYKVIDKEKVKCLLCPHNCVIQNEKTGICGVRKNNDGKLFTTIYGELTAMAMDPIEKKPLYHFYPTSNIFSIGTKGCNFRCSYCQNWEISQNSNVHTTYYKPEEIINAALRRNSLGIAYTYNEPFIWFEYVMDCSKLARKNGLKNVFVTNGFINPEPLDEILEYADAMNIDLKSFQENTYRSFQKGKLTNVLETIKKVYKTCHLELTTLIVTDMNNNMDEMKDMIDWISSIDANIPWHISRYYPNYDYNAPPTDINFMFKIHDHAASKLNFIYCGNIPGTYGRSDTICPSCKTIIISRDGYMVDVKAITTGGLCMNCGYDLYIKY